MLHLCNTVLSVCDALVPNQEKQSPIFAKQEIASPSYTIFFGGLLIEAFRGVAFFIPI